MAQWYKANKRWEDLAQELVDADPMNLGHIDFGVIEFLSFEEEKPKHTILIKNIKEPFTMLTGGKLYYIGINEEMMSNLDQPHQELEMLRILMHISREEPGKINFPDVYEFSSIINVFGHDWRDKNIKSVLVMMKSGQSIVA